MEQLPERNIEFLTVIKYIFFAFYASLFQFADIFYLNKYFAWRRDYMAQEIAARKTLRILYFFNKCKFTYKQRDTSLDSG